MTTHPHAPAFPSLETPEIRSSTGLSVRAYIATRAMERLVAGNSYDSATLARYSVEIADALIAELNKSVDDHTS